MEMWKTTESVSDAFLEMYSTSGVQPVFTLLLEKECVDSIA